MALGEASKLLGGFGVANLFPSSNLLRTISGTKPKFESIHKKIEDIMGRIVTAYSENKQLKGKIEGSNEVDLVDVLLRVQKHGGIDSHLSDETMKGVLVSHIFVRY